MLTIDTEVKGLKEADAFLRNLPLDVQRKMLGGALRDAAKPILDQAMLNVLTLFGGSRRSSGVLFSHITRSRFKRTTLATQVNVTLKRAKRPPGKVDQTINGVRKPYGDDPFYGLFLEKGRRSAATRTGRKIGPMPARPWLAPAGRTRQAEAGRVLQARLEKRMQTWCKKNGVKYVPSGMRG